MLYRRIVLGLRGEFRRLNSISSSPEPIVGCRANGQQMENQHQQQTSRFHAECQHLLAS